MATLPATMKINDLELILVEMPCETGRPPARWLLVRLATATGREGWGEARLSWRVAELSARREMLLAVLGGRNVFDIEELLTLEVLREPALRAALEMASWDLIGRALRQPIHRLFGGGYRQRVPVAARLADGPPERVAHLARELAEQGFHAQILTSSGDADADLRTLRAIREHAGDRTELRLDGCARFDPETARDLCDALEYESLEYLVDPLNVPDFHELAALGRQTSVPLAVWRAAREPADVLRLARTGAARFVVVDLARVGGMAPARKCAAVAEAAGLQAALAGSRPAGLATAAMLHVAASTPAFASSNESTCHRFADDLLTTPFEVTDGMIAVGQGPGLGVEIDRAKLEQYQVG